MRVCRNCGNGNPDDAVFCQSCNERLVEEEPAKVSQVGLFYTDPKRTILGAINDRDWSDRHISILWTFVAVFLIAPTFMSIIVSIIEALQERNEDLFSSDLAASAFTYARYLSVLLFAYLFGSLAANMLSRLNDHTEREDRLRTGMIGFVKANASSDEDKNNVKDDLAAMSSYDAQSLAFERKLPPIDLGFAVLVVFVTYGIIAFIAQVMRDLDVEILPPVLSAIATILYFCGLGFLFVLAWHLMRTIKTHSSRWNAFVDSTAVALSKLKFDVKIPEELHQLRARPIFVYVVLTFATFGLFGFFWLYVLIRDPNAHFENQWLFENELQKMLEG